MLKEATLLEHSNKDRLNTHVKASRDRGFFFGTAERGLYPEVTYIDF